MKGGHARPKNPAPFLKVKEKDAASETSRELLLSLLSTASFSRALRDVGSYSELPDTQDLHPELPKSVNVSLHEGQSECERLDCRAAIFPVL